MGKKCIICGDEACYCIKGTSECYCEECAKEHFSDIDLLVKVEEEAKAIKQLIKEEMKKINSLNETESTEELQK